MTLLDLSTNDNTKREPIDPPWKIIGKKNKEETLAWFQKTLAILESYSESRIETMVNNLLWYTGEFDKTLEYRMVVPGSVEKSLPKRILPRIFNHLFDITEQRVSKLSRYKPAFDVLPTNREENDRRMARLMKLCLDARARAVHMDFLMQELERWTAVFGECFVSIEWNQNIGDKKGLRSIERIGDVDIKIKAPWTVLPEPKRHWDDVNFVFDIESIMQIDEARKRFNKPKLEPDGKMNIFSFNQDVEEKRDDEVVVYRVIQKPCEYAPNGAMMTVVADTVVEVTTDKYPYSHYDFPFERHTDIDVPGRLFPMSFYSHIKPIQHVYNKLTSLITRNILLTAHPHILMPKGAAKIEAFGNSTTAIEYTGPVEPRIATFNSVPSEAFQFRNEVRQEIGQVSGIQGVSRGAPPAGARAASMLRFYEEQEEQRASTQIIKHNEVIRRMLLKSASVIGDYYPTGPKERMVRVVGKENEYMIQAFQGSKISSEYDIIIQNSTGFSESMAGRLEEIQMIQQFAPGLLSPDQIADVLELKNPQKAYDVSTAAIKQAEDENQMFLDGRDVPHPQKYQDLLVHWRTHMILMNSSTWEINVPDGIKQAMEDHVLATEYLMEEKAKINPTFAKLLESLPGYPAFWTPTPEVPQQQPQQQQPQMPPMDAAGMPSPQMSDAMLMEDQGQNGQFSEIDALAAQMEPAIVTPQ